MKYILKYQYNNFYKIYPKSVYYGNWRQQIWKKDSWRHIIKDELQDISYSLLIREFYKKPIFIKDNKRFINECFKYLLKKSRNY